MGEMLLNGRLYGASGIRELTQAQYDALPDSKYSDGILYCIKDTGIVEGDKYAPVIYSLEEREVGVWTNGKPLYQKSYFIDSLPSSAGYKDISLGLSNISVKRSYGDVYFPSGATRPLDALSMDSTDPTTLYMQYQITYTIESNSYIRVLSGNDRSHLSAIVTIQYTKTTDAPGSGTWGTDGVPMVHYDENERIIGTWFGETLYEKTIDCGAIHSTGSHSTAHGIQNIKRVVKICGNCVSDSNMFFPLPLVQSGDILSYQIRVAVNNTNIILSTQSVTDIASTYVTLQYTKTS